MASEAVTKEEKKEEKMDYTGCRQCMEAKTPPAWVRYRSTLLCEPPIDVYECSFGHRTRIRQQPLAELQSIPVSTSVPKSCLSSLEKFKRRSLSQKKPSGDTDSQWLDSNTRYIDGIGAVAIGNQEEPTSPRWVDGSGWAT